MLIAMLDDPANLLHEFKDSFFTQLIQSGDSPEMIDRLRTVFLSPDAPAWSKLFTLVSLRYASVVENARNGYNEIEYPIKEIPFIRQPLGQKLDPLLASDDQISMRNLTTLDAQELKRYLVDMSDTELEAQVGQPVPFNRMKKEYRLQIFAHYLRDVVEHSVGQEYKASADVRNRENVADTLTIEAGTLLHGTSILALPKILSLGSLCGEALEVGHGEDLTPLQVDLALFDSQDTAVGGEAIQKLGNTVQSEYGNFTIMFKRSDTSKDSTVLHNHGPWATKGQILIPGGIASTEITGIYLKDGIDEVNGEKNSGIPVNIQTVKRQIVRNGFYIPIYDKQGKLIFEPQEFDAIKARLDSPTARQQWLDTAVATDELSPREFIDVLSEDPELEARFSANSGVSEGYTLREHTEAVLGQFEKNFARSYSSKVLPRSAFRKMLALHDIGKAQGVEATGSTAAQHAYTLNVLHDKAASVGLSETEAHVVGALLEHDYLGEFIKGTSSLESTAAIIQEIAENIGATPKVVVDLLETYYICDASSYTDDASYSNNSGTGQVRTIPSINFVFDFSNGQLRLSETNRNKMEQLRAIL